MSSSPAPTTDATGSVVECSVRYLRVSSKRQMDTDADIDPEGNSIDTQRKVTAAKERALGTVNVGEYVEPGNSALTISKRPEFRKMLERVMLKRDVRYVVIYQRSRAFRNFADAVIVKRQLEKLGVKLISAKEDFGEGVWADAMEGITDIFNEVQVRLNGQDIALKMGNKARNGGTLGKAKLGYVNETKNIEGHRVNTISLDPERAKYIPMAFELFATARYTIDELRDQLAEAGLTMPPDVLNEAYRLYKTRTHHRAAPDSARNAMRSAAHSSRAPHDRSTLIDSLTSVFDLGWSKPILVGTAGFEPATP